jgi:membrane-anchored protein YejM (alkaline phosphatase superfamily)
MDTAAVVFTRAYSPSNSSYRSLAILFGAEGNRHTLYPAFGLENTLSKWLKKEEYAPVILSEGNGVAGLFAPEDSLVLIGQPVDHATGKNQPLEEQLAKFLQALPPPSDSIPFFGYLHWMDVHNDLYAKPGIPLERDTPFDLYRHNVRYQSSLWPAFIDSLKRRGVYNNTMIVLVGDHGEEFKEHESTLHGHHFFEQDMHVPLVWRIPGVEAKTIEAHVSTADWIPTLFDLTGYRFSAPIYPDGYVESQAESMLKRASPQDSTKRSFYFQSNMTDKIGFMHAGRWKYEYWPTYDAEALFDLESDPTEHRNAIEKHRNMADSLRKVVTGWSERMNGHRY